MPQESSRKRKVVSFATDETSRPHKKTIKTFPTIAETDRTENPLWLSRHEMTRLRKDVLKERDTLLRKTPESELYAQSLWLAYVAGPVKELIAPLECGLARGVESLFIPQLALQRAALRKISIQAVLHLQKELSNETAMEEAISAVYMQIADQAGGLAQCLGKADEAAAKSLTKTGK